MSDRGRRIVVLSGGVGGARFTRGLLAALRDSGHGGPSAAGEVTVVGNTGDDITLFGLRVCPDLDTVMYTLGGGIDEQQGWGRAGDSRAVLAELTAYGEQPSWFGLGDLDLATHIARTRMLAEGRTLSEATSALCARWNPGVTLVPMSDDPVETHVILDADDGAGTRLVHFQEWWVRLHAAAPARGFVFRGADTAAPAPGVQEALREADVVVLAPSNPVVSTGSILAVPGISSALRATPAPVVGVSPIIAGAPLRGMADACLAAIGVETSAQAVGRHYGPDLLDGWLVDDADAAATVPGVAVRSCPLYMRDVATSAAIAREVLTLADDVRAGNVPR